MTSAANLLAFFGLVAALLIAWRQSWPGRIRLFAGQSVILAALAGTLGVLAAKPTLVAAAAVFAVLKVWVIPRALRRMAAGLPARAPGAGRWAGVSVIAAAALVVVAYVVMLPVTQAATLPTSGAIPLAFAAALIGLLVCVTGRDALGQVLGFLVFENGVFAMALLATYGLPGLVEVGVFLDVLVIVLIMEGVVVELRREHESVAVDRLGERRG